MAPSAGLQIMRGSFEMWRSQLQCSPNVPSRKGILTRPAVVQAGYTSEFRKINWRTEHCTGRHISCDIWKISSKSSSVLSFLFHNSPCAMWNEVGLPQRSPSFGANCFKIGYFILGEYKDVQTGNVVLEQQGLWPGIWGQQQSHSTCYKACCPCQSHQQASLLTTSPFLMRPAVRHQVKGNPEIQLLQHQPWAANHIKAFSRATRA